MRKDDVRAFERLMTLPSIDGLSLEVALERIGALIDLADDLEREEGITRALEWCDVVESRRIPDAEAALLDYFRANAWAGRQNKRHATATAAWAWEQPELREQVFCLRRASNNLGFEKLDPLRRCQIFTNLGNQLNFVGRFVDALEYWGRALAIRPQFGMALGNRGIGLSHYARALYDDGHQAVFLKFAHDDLTAALGPLAEYDSPLYTQAKSSFEARKDSIQSVLDVDLVSRSIDLDGHELGASQQERSYRNWCLANKLFLNPLNDLGQHAIAARDVLTLPDFVTSVEEPPTLVGLFNQMKQEFASSRWLYYEGIHSDDVHFSDRGVLLYNTLDYPIYSLAIEKVKSAYRTVYSLFDKIGFFLNSYMKLGVEPELISFRKVWYGKGAARKRMIRPEFDQSENWPLRGLFWLAKDLFEVDFRDVMEPDAQALHEIRNRLEHRYLKVHDMLFQSLRDPVPTPLVDRLAYSVQRRDFEAKTLRLLKLTRAAFIYVSLGMHFEEKRRGIQGQGGLVVPMPLDLWDDDWKR